MNLEEIDTLRLKNAWIYGKLKEHLEEL